MNYFLSIVEIGQRNIYRCFTLNYITQLSYYDIIMEVIKMKVTCVYCDHDLSKLVGPRFDQYEVGKIICPQCHKENKRYISEYDLMLHFISSIIIYSGCLMLIIGTLLYMSPFIPIYVLIPIILIILVLGFFGIKLSSKYLYLHSYKKNTWMNWNMNDDAKEVSKRMKYQFIMFMLVSFVVGTQKELLLFYAVLILAFVALTIVKAYMCYKRERTYFHEKNK